MSEIVATAQWKKLPGGVEGIEFACAFTGQKDFVAIGRSSKSLKASARKAFRNPQEVYMKLEAKNFLAVAYGSSGRDYLLSNTRFTITGRFESEKSLIEEFSGFILNSIKASSKYE